MKKPRHARRIAVVGLGYVGLPVAAAFARSGAETIGFDTSEQRVRELGSGFDKTGELTAKELKSAPVRFSTIPDELRSADFFIVTVPTPVDDALRPDLGALRSASRTVGAAIARGAIVVYESTVYPGATEEECVPELERASGLKCGVDFFVGYSPERVNPGDRKHRFETIQKIVSAMDAATLEIVAEVYGSVIAAGIFRATSIKVAEAAKVIENSQRDINIAFMNELSAIFHRLGIDTNDVLAAASTKWNFLQFSPGLVGGHCIGVDPYYLTYRAQRAGYHPEVILSGRRINDNVGHRIAQECVRLLAEKRCSIPHVAVLGCTFKEDVPDIRNSKVFDIISELKRFSISVEVCDPFADTASARHEYSVDLALESEMAPADAVILAVPHAKYLTAGWAFVQRFLKPDAVIVMDIKGRLPRTDSPSNLIVWRL